MEMRAPDLPRPFCHNFIKFSRQELSELAERGFFKLRFFRDERYKVRTDAILTIDKMIYLTFAKSETA